jgi:MFS family permease
MSPAPDPAAKPEGPAAPVGGPYANYVLGVLVVVYVMNFLDRQILSILAEDIRRDLGVSDQDLGFLYGTAFAVFYALFGIPLGRLADVWSRRSLIALGLAGWSGMTALSGLARGFGELALARIGVGIGEASATPAAFSMLSDSFPPARRATVLALYSGGIYLGGGLGLGIGGFVVDAWNHAWAGQAAPFGLRGWQVAFLVVGLPGLVLALWVRSLREPVRGAADGIRVEPEPHPWRAFGRELAAVLPPFTLLHLAAVGGARALVRNLALAACAAAAATALALATGDTAQWCALGVGIYAAASWAQGLALREPGSFDVIFRQPSLRASAVGFALLAFTGYGLGFWVPPFIQRVHGVSAAESGLVLGGTAALGGWLGVAFGGLAADRWRRRRIEGRLHWGIATALAPLPVAVGFLYAPSAPLAYLLNVPLSILSAMWIGAGASTVQDLVPPPLRARASAAYLLVITFIGLALGPYGIGKASAAFGELRLGMLLALGANLLAVVFLARAARRLPGDEARARAAAGRPG